MIDFNTAENYILENEIVRLSPMVTEDYYAFLPFALQEPQLWQYSLFSAAGIEGLKHYINKALEARQKGTEYPFTVFDKRTQEIAGSTRFYDIQTANKTLQLGYTWYGKKFQGTRLNQNCKLLLLQFAFEKLQIERVEFRADNRNKKSIAAMKSIGCVEEGILRSHAVTTSGERRDSIVLSILKKEWESGIKEKLIEKIAQKC